MEKTLVFAEAPEHAGSQLEKEVAYRLAPEWKVQIIWDLDYLEEYFQQERQLDALLVEEEFYGKYLKRHQIAKTVVLSAGEYPEEAEPGVLWIDGGSSPAGIVELLRQ